MFQMVGIFSEFEREIIRARVLAGQKRYVDNGGKMGRPSNITDGLIKSVKFMREKKIGIQKIARDLGIGVSTVYKVLEV